MTRSAEIEAALRAFATARGAGKTFCPSEVARQLSPDWRGLMPEIRSIAARMQTKGVLTATQKGRPVIADQAQGPIRLGLATGQDAQAD